MKSAEPKSKQPSKVAAKASRDATPVRHIEKETRPLPTGAPRTPPPAGNGHSPMPDLTTFGIPQDDAQAHVPQCEECGRAYTHVVRNPKDVMALQSFARRLASCLAGKQNKARA